MTSVISFSSSLFSAPQIQDKSIRAGSSKNILTWQQCTGKEDLATMKACLAEFVEDRKACFRNKIRPVSLSSSKVHTYDVHDVKMLYLLTQHSLWNRKYNPFLMCGCERDQGLDDSNHICKMYTDEQYRLFYDRSKKKWDQKSSSLLLQGNTYSISSHRKWCDEKNHGVTHFGVSPDSYPLSSIRFDTFHMKCAITRRIMDTLRDFMLKQGTSMIKKFTTDILMKIWNDFHVYCWNNSLNFSKFQGNDLKAFVKFSDRTVDFLKSNLAKTRLLTEFCTGLALLPSLFEFVSRTYTCPAYPQDLKQFEKNIDVFYKSGKETYMSGGNVPSYFHIFRFYMPQIAKVTYEKHKLGLGIFNMQGFERRNKESKNQLARASTGNRKNPKLLVNNLKRLELNFIS